jgi:hypothetical protein
MNSVANPKRKNSGAEEKSRSLSALSVQNLPKFGSKFFWLLHFCSALFEICGRTISQLVILMAEIRNLIAEFARTSRTE